MKAKVIQLSDWKNKTMKIDAKMLSLLLKHHRLASFARMRGYSPVAIKKLELAAEASKKKR